MSGIGQVEFDFKDFFMHFKLIPSLMIFKII